MIDRNNVRAQKILKENLDKLHLLAKALLQYETVNAEDFKQVMAGQEIKKIISVPEPVKEEKTESKEVVVDLSKPVKA